MPQDFAGDRRPPRTTFDLNAQPDDAGRVSDTSAEICAVHFEARPPPGALEFADGPAGARPSEIVPNKRRLGISKILSELHASRWGRSHLLDRAPLIVSVVLGMLIAADLARAALLLGGGSSSLHEATPIKNDQTALRGSIDVNGIVATHLFGQAADDPGAQDPDNAPPAPANLRLAGTLAMQDPKSGFAIISDDGRSKAYKVGQDVSGADLQSVYRDHAILKRAGRLEMLAFSKSPPAGSHFVAAANLPSQLAANPKASEVVHGAPSASPDGRLRGFRIFPGDERQTFMALGLHPGELIVAVNGVSLENQDRKTGQEIFDSLGTLSQPTVTVVDRGGNRRNVTIDTTKRDAPEKDESAEQTDPAER